ncbi:MAG: dihydroorotate dehydrogenase electron transfer subunit [Bacteroidales bacterium]|jgi:dihydroorotate dehydrogenase electron transfer subunit
MKYIKDFKILKNITISDDTFVLELQLRQKLPIIFPGQFVEVLINKSKNTFLRRPFSIHDVNTSKNTISLFIKKVGEGTEALSKYKVGDIVNIIFPLGKGFNLVKNKKVLLIGGGCGIAPLLYLSKRLNENNNEIHVLLGGRSKEDIIKIKEFKKYGKVYISTENGSLCERGLLTQNSVLKNNFDKIYACGPAPMLKAVAKIAKEKNTECEVSLENIMACGIGACLCCVVETKKGNQCVCTEGPVFNINDLTWQI